MKILSLFLKGFACGTGTVIPGVSGGTVAVLTGIFEKLLSAVASLKKQFFKSFMFLLPFGIGALSAILLFSRPITYFCSEFPFQTNIFFCLCSAVSLMIFFKKSIVLPLKAKDVIMIFSGILCAFLSSVILSYKNIFLVKSFFGLLFCGLLLSLALILPAISFSYMLLFFGIYEKTLKAVADFDVFFLLPLALGIASGTFFFSAILKKAIGMHRQKVYCLIFGFVVFSLFGLILRTFLYC